MWTLTFLYWIIFWWVLIIKNKKISVSYIYKTKLTEMWDVVKIAQKYVNVPGWSF